MQLSVLCDPTIARPSASYRSLSPRLKNSSASPIHPHDSFSFPPHSICANIIRACCTPARLLTPSTPIPSIGSIFTPNPLHRFHIHAVRSTPIRSTRSILTPSFNTTHFHPFHTKRCTILFHPACFRVSSDVVFPHSTHFPDKKFFFGMAGSRCN